MSSDIETIVNPIFANDGVPAAIWETIATVESGMNPNAIGDNGTSYGLFQLHEGGQLPADYNNNPSPVLDPALNAQIAAPAIAAAYKSTPGSPSTLSYWVAFAAASGHPGGSSSNPATQAEALKLYQQYNSTSGASTVGGSTLASTSSGGDCNWANPLTYPTCVQNSVSNDITTAVGSVLTPLKTGFLKIGVFLIALLLLIVGFWVIGNKDTSS